MANFNLNKITLGGRLTADPELKQTQSGVMVTSFGLAVNRKRPDADGEYKTDFFKVTAWRTLAEFITRYFRKGSSICIIGEAQLRDYTDHNGVKHPYVAVQADEAYFVDSKATAQSGTPIPETDDIVAGNGLSLVPDDEDLPF